MIEGSKADIIAQTERLILRRPVEGDLDLWLEHLNTRQMTEHLGGPRTREQVVEKFDKMTRSWEAYGYSFLMVTDRAGTFLGTAGLGRIEIPHAPAPLRDAVQIGWQLRADHWGQGYALEAARAMLDFGFGRAGIDPIYSQTSPRNRASWRLIEKLGMQRRADLDYEDPSYPPDDNPTIVYAIGAEDWARRAGERAA